MKKQKTAGWKKWSCYCLVFMMLFAIVTITLYGLFIGEYVGVFAFFERDKKRS